MSVRSPVAPALAALVALATSLALPGPARARAQPAPPLDERGGARRALAPDDTPPPAEAPAPGRAAPPADAPAPADAPLDPSWVAARAVARSARLRALDARVAAAAARAEGEGALEDPMLMARVWGVPWDVVSRPPDQTMFMARQVVPLSGIRGRRRDLAASAVTEARVEREAAEHAVRMDAELAYVALAEALDRRRAVAALVEATTALATLATARATTAPLAAVDVATARAAVARARAELRAAEALVQARRVELAALLDVDDPATLPDPAPLREAEAPAPLAALVARARRDRPETRYAEAARARARATAAVADASDGPLLDLGAGVMIMPHGTGLMLDVGITLPVWRGPRRARQAEAAALAAEADAAEESWRLSLLRELASALAARQAAIARRDALRDEVLPALEARRSTALAAYAAAATGASGAGASLESVAEGLREEATLRADLAAAQGEIARADVWLAHALGAHEVPWAAATRTDGGPGGAGARPHEGGARGPASSAGSREHGDAARDSEVRR